MFQTPFQKLFQLLQRFPLVGCACRGALQLANQRRRARTRRIAPNQNWTFSRRHNYSTFGFAPEVFNPSVSSISFGSGRLDRSMARNSSGSASLATETPVRKSVTDLGVITCV